MGLRDLDLKLSYRSDNEDEIIKDFYIPVLSNAVKYKRAVGYFSSAVLIQISKGISRLIENGGKMQIVASPELTEEDIEAIKYGYELKEKVISRALLRKLKEPINELEADRYNYIAHLIANDQLDIKIALVDDGLTNGIYHEKIGIVEDYYGDIIAFTGSLNETDSAMQRNFESIDVFKSWTGDSDAKRVENKVRDFERLWNNETDRLTIYQFPEALTKEILKYKKSSYKKESEILILKEEQGVYIFTNYPKYPEWFQIRPYQEEAIIKWKENGYKGLLNMATGTGKTFTALAATVHLWEELNYKLAIIIVCPYTHLVEQWKEDVINFNMDPIIAYSTSEQRDWANVLKNKIHRYNMGVLPNICVITTVGTYKTKKFQDLINEIEDKVLFIVDEAHNAGAPQFLKYLHEQFEYRLALSATPDRHYDDEGTARLKNYFNKEVFYFGLEDAIEKGFLVRYYYEPIIVSLDDEEYVKYIEISREITRYLINDGEKIKLTKKAEMLLIQRARLIAGAKNKLKVLRELMESRKDSFYNLVYCGSTYVEDEVRQEEIRQINAVTNILGNELNMRVAKFTSEETRAERTRIIEDFSSGDNLQAIVAIKCLDEGVNIPAIRNAYILASSTNPREFIQRRGRVLRTFPNKKFAYIYDFITLPRDLNKVPLASDIELKYDYSLIERELGRAKEFASLSENKYSSLEKIEDIENAYRKFLPIGADINAN